MTRRAAPRRRSRCAFELSGLMSLYSVGCDSFGLVDSCKKRIHTRAFVVSFIRRHHLTRLQAEMIAQHPSSNANPTWNSATAVAVRSADPTRLAARQGGAPAEPTPRWTAVNGARISSEPRTSRAWIMDTPQVHAVVKPGTARALVRRPSQLRVRHWIIASFDESVLGA